MEEIREIAQAYLATEDKKKAAEKFFREMDSDDDKTVSLQEFLDYMRREGYADLRRAELFKQLRSDKSEHLMLEDVMTLFYIIQSGRQFCDGCDKFIEGTYFCCIHCFRNSDRNYCLCTQCITAEKYINRPDHCHEFLDNFALLELKRIEAKGAAVSSQVSSQAPVPAVRAASTSPALYPATQVSSQALIPAVRAASTSRALYPAIQVQRRKREKLLKMLMVGANVAQIISCNLQ